MTEETGAAAPATEQAQPEAAKTEQATPAASVPQETAAAENAETKDQETGQESTTEETPRKLSRWQRMQRKNARLATMLAEQSAELETLRAKTADAPKPPQEADFNGDYFAYQSAKTVWEMDQRLDAKLAKLIPAQQKPDARELNKQEVIEDLRERIVSAKEHLPDFEQSLAGLQQQVGDLSGSVLEEIGESDKGEFILYHLAKNPQLAASLNRMSDRDVAREIARLESKVSLPQPKKQTQAPPPLSKLTGGAAPSVTAAEAAKADDMASFVKIREAEEKARAR